MLFDSRAVLFRLQQQTQAVQEEAGARGLLVNQKDGDAVTSGASWGVRVEVRVGGGT